VGTRSRACRTVGVGVYRPMPAFRPSRTAQTPSLRAQHPPLLCSLTCPPSCTHPP
jgi:hypothetical protein